MDYDIGEESQAVDGENEPAWYDKLLSTVQSTAPAYFQLRSQDQLMRINLARAEQGLPPISSADIAPTVNMGVSPGVQTLGYVAVGGLVLVGLLSMLNKRR